MPPPNFPEKHRFDAILNPSDIIRYRKQLRRLPDLDGISNILFSLDRSIPLRMRWRVPVKKAGGMIGDLYLVRKPRHQVGVMVNMGGGAPIVVELAEEFAALGFRRMALMTWGGSLQPDLRAGDIVVCNRAIRDEGVSYHYLPPDKLISADPLLVEQLVAAIQAKGGKCTVGTTWTTDAPYRETAAEIRQYQSEGVKTVEMESAGLFTIGKVRDIQAVSAVVIMDSLANLRWEVPDRLDGIIKSLEIVYLAMIEVLSQPQNR